MKKTLSLFLITVILFGFNACTQAEAPEVPVNFYYVRNQYDYGTDGGVIAAEVREAAGLSPDEILTTYLNGPVSEHLRTPFPDAVVVNSYDFQAKKLVITLSSEFSQLLDLDLTLACACLTVTCAELFDIETVTVTADGALLDGHQSISMDVNNIVLFDKSTIVTADTSANE